MQKFLLPRNLPEDENINPDGIEEYLQTIDKSGLQYHSFMLVRNGNVVSEHFFNGHGPGKPHPLYSVAKVITGISALFAISEDLIKPDDKVIKLFPDDLPDEISPYLGELEIYHLLTMSVGHRAAKIGREADNGNDNWIRLFLSAPINHKPGTVFEYNNIASFMISAIIQKVSGNKLIDYIYPRLFKPLGIEKVSWDENPQGINVGGWGMSLKTEDMAKIGLFLLQKGNWQDNQLLPEALVEEACSLKVNTTPLTATQEEKDKNDWYQGYGYHIWQSRHNAFSAYGFHGQLIIIIPEKQTVVVTTGKITDVQAQLNMIWKYILPALKTGQ